MRKLLIFGLFIASAAFAQQSNMPTVQVVDPCLQPSIAKQSVAISVTSATTTSLVSVFGTTAVYVCSFSLTMTSIIVTATTAQFEYGTGASCSSPTVLTGAYGAGGIVSGINLSVTQSAPLRPTPAATGVCLVSTGATVNIQGVMTFVQQ